MWAEERLGFIFPHRPHVTCYLSGPIYYMPPTTNHYLKHIALPKRQVAASFGIGGVGFLPRRAAEQRKNVSRARQGVEQFVVSAPVKFGKHVFESPPQCVGIGPALGR